MKTSTADQTLLVRLPLGDDESLRGYVVRLSEANRCDGKLTALRPALHAVSRSLAHIERLSGVEAATLGARVALTTMSERGDRYRLGRTQMHRGGIWGARRTVCPQCVRERMPTSCLWELRVYDTCCRHGCLLVSACGGCTRPLTWRSSPSSFCAHCGRAFGAMPVVPASGAQTEIARLLAGALAESLRVPAGGGAHGGFAAAADALSELIFSIELAKALFVPAGDTVGMRQPAETLLSLLRDDDFQRFWRGAAADAARALRIDPQEATAPGQPRQTLRYRFGALDDGMRLARFRAD